MKYALFFAAALLFFASCSKLEDGPAISFRSKENRLIGKWKLTKWMEDGVDITSSQTNGVDIVFQFEENRSLTIDRGQDGIFEGSWNLEENNVIMDLQMLSEFGNYIDKDTLFLKRLTNKEIVARYNDVVETELVFEAQ
jgi:hypothetical protein